MGSSANPPACKGAIKAEVVDCEAAGKGAETGVVLASRSNAGSSSKSMSPKPARSENPAEWNRNCSDCVKRTINVHTFLFVGLK